MTTTKRSAEPLVYDIAEDGRPILTGVRDTSGHISFPYQQFGSLCNGDHDAQLTPVDLSGRGRVQAAVTIEHHADPDVRTPFTLADIILDEGPVVRGVLTATVDGFVGTLVEATTEPIVRADETLYELRFHAVGGEEQ
ncbi:OB-fold domain-containing protein [Gordonia sp. CPCC 205515]|uniref:Zn-ribbon domain-containing OB-fold protein n=1 Tax=Gordonia sp. CPCC 205515 TaxID=3140791 RepID=UPI003AF394E5